MTTLEHAHAAIDTSNTQQDLHAALDERDQPDINPPVAQSSLIGGETSNGVEETGQLPPSTDMVEANNGDKGREGSDEEEESGGSDETDEDEEYETAEDEDDSDEDEDDSDEEDEDEDTDGDSDESFEGGPYPVFTWDTLDSPPLPLPRHSTTLPPKTAKGMLSNPYSASPSSDRTFLQKQHPYERWIPPAETMRHFGRPQVNAPSLDRRYDIWLPPGMASHQDEKGRPPRN